MQFSIFDTYLLLNDSMENPVHISGHALSIAAHVNVAALVYNVPDVGGLRNIEAVTVRTAKSVLVLACDLHLPLFLECGMSFDGRFKMRAVRSCIHLLDHFMLHIFLAGSLSREGEN